MDNTPPTADFHDERIAMSNWYPKIKDLDIPIPETYQLPLDHQEDGPPEWETETAKGFVKKLGGEAFVRSEYKSAQIALKQGSHIRNPSSDEINKTITELIFQHVMMEMPLGKNLYLREKLDLNFCAYCRENLVPEIRVFIRDGNVACYHPRLEGFDNAPDDHRETAIEYIESGWDGSHREQTVKECAEQVAKVFEEEGWYSVDFVLDKNGEWYLTDMALDALYERNGKIQNISEHPGDCKHDLENW